MGENVRIKQEKYSTTDGDALVIQPSSTGFTIEQLLSYPASGNNSEYYNDVTNKQGEYTNPCQMYEIEKTHLPPSEYIVAAYPDPTQSNDLQPYQGLYYQEDPESTLKQIDPSLKRSWQSAFGRGHPSTSSDPECTGTTEGSQDTMFEIVVKAIMSARDGEILLSEIYNYIVTHYAKFRDAEKSSWRVTVRHALSVNSCFIKGKKAKNGRGYYWKIHPACLDLFSNNDLDRKKAAKLVQQSSTQSNCSTENTQPMDDDGRQHVSPVVCPPGHNPDPPYDEHMDNVRHYVPMTTIPLMSYTYYELLVNLCDLRDQQ